MEATPTGAVPEAATAAEITPTGDAPEVAVVTGPVPTDGGSETAVAMETVPADPTVSMEEPTVVMGLEAADVPAREEPPEVVVLSPSVAKPAVEVGDTAVASTSVDPATSPVTTLPVKSLQGVLRVPPSASQFLDDIERNAEEHVQNIKLLRETVEVITSQFNTSSRCSPRVSGRLIEVELKLMLTFVCSTSWLRHNLNRQPPS
jgi:hypothetical protein